MNGIDRIFISTYHDNCIDRMNNAFLVMLKKSTWYGCESVRGYPSEEELYRLVKGVIYYINTHIELLYENENVIDSTGLNSRIGVFELAESYSVDFLSEAAYAIPRAKTANELKLSRDRLSAACMFHYKYCCIHEKLFAITWINKWIDLTNNIYGLTDVSNNQLEYFLATLGVLDGYPR